jgi:hypothetical protein
MSPDRGQIRPGSRWLGPPPGLSRPQQDSAVVRHECRVVRVDRVRVARDLGLSHHDLPAGPLELGPERGMLLLGAGRIGGSSHP